MLNLLYRRLIEQQCKIVSSVFSHEFKQMDLNPQVGLRGGYTFLVMYYKVGRQCLDPRDGLLT